MSYEKPYAGLRVVDLSQGIAGPYCAMLLAQYGADVVKVEPPEGDWSRVLGPRYGSHTAFSVIGNLGKRSVVLDLKQAEDKEKLRRLVRTADVFMEGFRPGVAARLGFDFETVKALAPGIVYVSVSGFGQTGPLSAKPAMDPVLQAFTGFTLENKGHDGIPHRANPVIVDMSTALYTHQAVAAAIYARRDDPRARFIDSSLMAAAANLQAVRMCATVMEGGPMRVPTSPSGVFRTADGWLHLVVLKDSDFQALCGLIDRADLAADPRFAGPAGRAACAEELNAAVGEHIAAQPTAHWQACLTEAGLQNEAVQDYAQFAAHPHTEATGLISRLAQPGGDRLWPVPNPAGAPPLVSGSPEATAPALGQHTGEVLLELEETEDSAAAEE